MKKRIISRSLLVGFKEALRNEEKSENTLEKYMRDVQRFYEYAGNRTITKELILAYKSELEKRYAITSANSMLAALNTFFRFAGWEDCFVKQFKMQKQAYCPEEKELTREEYIRLIRTAEEKHNERLSLMIQTICGTGIRVSELQYITVEALKRGRAVVSCKGKVRTVFIVRDLRAKLLHYAELQEISAGAVFVTRGGKPLDRSNIWRDMKELCEEANVPPDKVFPHNLRHLFARVFYETEKDIAKLADILGHSSINTTRIYIATTGAEHAEKMERMNLII